MATIVNTTEEEPMLAVVRFTAELAWADAGPEVADPEVTRLCLEAQEHILAGRWLDMASLMLASADLLLTSPSRVSDKDLECVLSVICSLVTKAGSEDQALQITELICAKLTQQHGDKPALRLKVVYVVFSACTICSRARTARHLFTRRLLSSPRLERLLSTSSHLSRTLTVLSVSGELTIWRRGSYTLLSPPSSKTTRAWLRSTLTFSISTLPHSKGQMMNQLQLVMRRKRLLRQSSSLLNRLISFSVICSTCQLFHSLRRTKSISWCMNY
ncbi:Proteasome component (PCI) domain protein [Zea mays]|uniref:Proteasome component (PCI) domain protein n=1 Tax=Zea mays TaxID=4577 RepID=A0A1D6FF79_MAIZE|nr:Proteasome component (PCI) domain protein [Zea mays]